MDGNEREGNNGARERGAEEGKEAGREEEHKERELARHHGNIYIGAAVTAS